jgi:formamidopyrimidine-DNA glycosylase
MPELPEVETTRRIIEPYLLQHSLDIWHTDPARYQTQQAKGQRVEATSRRGKYIFLHLSGGLELIVHLGMTGGFRFVASPHTRLTVQAGPHTLYYTDARRFGKWWTVPSGDYGLIGLLGRMGPEPLEENFTLDLFKKALSGRRQIKELLLSQEAVAGIGNIYADESLWQSKIHPSRTAESLQPEEIQRLYQSLKDILKRAVDAGGSTLSDASYQQPTGQPGYFQFSHNAYAKTGQPCTHQGCKGSITKTVVAGRGTHFCPACQNESPKHPAKTPVPQASKEKIAAPIRRKSGNP